MGPGGSGGRGGKGGNGAGIGSGGRGGGGGGGGGTGGIDGTDQDISGSGEEVYNAINNSSWAKHLDAGGYGGDGNGNAAPTNNEISWAFGLYERGKNDWKYRVTSSDNGEVNSTNAASKGGNGGAGGDDGTSASYVMSNTAKVDSTTGTSSPELLEPPVAYRTFTLNRNGGAGGASSAHVVFGATEGANLSVPTCKGYNFKGYYTAESGGTQLYDENGNPTNELKPFTNTAYLSLSTLHAQWQAITYQVEYYDETGGTQLYSDKKVTYGADYTLYDHRGNDIPEGKTFDGWSLTAYGRATYNAGKTVRNLCDTQGETLKLYAVYQDIPDLTITYDANGGSGAPARASVPYGSEYTIPSQVPTRDGYTFQYWLNSDPDVPIVPAKPGSKFIALKQNLNLYAVWKHNPSVTYDANGGYFTTSLPVDYPSPEGTYKLTDTVPVREGYNFKGWKHSGGKDIYHSGATYKLSGSYDALIFTAQWEEEQYLLTLDNAEGVSLNFDTPASVTNGKTFAYKTAFTFTANGDGTVRVYVNGVLLSPQDDDKYHFTMTDNTTVKTTLTPTTPEYIVSYDPNGGHDAPNDNGSYPKNTAVTVKGQGSMFRTGYTFTGWKDDRGNDVGSSFAIVKDTVLYAQWTANKYTVKYNANDGTSGVKSDDLTYDDPNGKILKNDQDGTSFAKKGHSFMGWAYSPDGPVSYLGGETALNLTAEPNGEITLYAIWTPKEYTVTLDAMGGTHGTSCVKATYGKELPGIVVPLRTGYTFVGYYDSQNGGSQYYDANGVSTSNWNKENDTKLYAHWTANTYTVKYVPNGGSGNMVDSTMTYDVIGRLTANAFTKDGYQFMGWALTSNGPVVYQDGESVKNLASEQNAIVTLYAVWEPIPTYTVTYNANGGTGGPTDSAPVLENEQYTIPDEKPTRDGYRFLGWSENPAAQDVQYSAGNLLTMTRNITLYAVWQAKQTYQITYNANAGSDTVLDMPANAVKVHDETYTISSRCPVREGYDFVGWSTAADGSVEYAANEQYTGNAALILYAVWEAKTYKLTLSDNGVGTIAVRRGSDTLVSGDTIRYGDVLDITATPLNGYSTAAFWCLVNGSIVSTDSASAITTQLTVTGNVDITLLDRRSTEVRYTIRYDKNGGTGRIADQTVTSTDTTAALSNGTGFTKDHATLIGWNTAADGSGTSYALGETLTVPIAADGQIVTLYAVWRAVPTYGIYYHANGGTGGPAPSGEIYEVGADAAICFTPAPTRDGYTFLGWSEDQNATTARYTEGRTTMLTMGSANVTLYAIWQREAYSITLEGNGVADVTVTTPANAAGEKFSGGTTVEFTVTATEPNVLNSLTVAVNGAVTQMTNANGVLKGSFVIDRDSTISVHSGAQTYRVTYDANGGTPTQAATIACITGESVTLHSGAGYARDGFHITGWNTEPDGSGTSYALSALVASFNVNTTLYAVWTDDRGYSYTIVYDANGGSGQSVSQDMYQNRLDTQLYGVSQTGFSKDHATLSGWATAPNGSVSYALDSRLHAPIGAAGQTVTLYAVWQAENAYAVRYDANGGVGGPTDNGMYYEDDTVDVQFDSVPTRVGYTFLGWSKDRNAAAATFTGSGTTTLTMGRANVTLYAVWQQNAATYTVRYDANGGSGIPVDGNAYSTGANVTVLFTPQPSKAGWTFLGWARSSAAVTPDYTTQNASFRMGSSNVTLYAVWKQIRSYTVIYNANAGSDLVIGLPGNGTKAEGVSYVISQTIPARDGYTFLKWNTAADGGGTDFHIGQSYTEDRDLTLYAVWRREAYSITLEDNGVASVMVTTPADAAGGKFSGGTTVEFTVSAIAPNVLNSLTVAVNGAVTQMTNANGVLKGSFVIDRDSTISVHSGAQTYRVTYDANGGEPAQSETVTYVTGQPLTLHSGRSYTRSGYHLTGWNTAADSSGMTYALGAVLTSDLQAGTLYAMWEQDDPRGYRYTIEYDSNGGSGANVRQTMYQNELDTVLYGVSQTGFAKDGSTLIGWATAPNGSVSYALDSRLPAPLGAAGQTVTLYAVWQLNEITVTLSDPQNVNTVPSIMVRVGSMYGVLPILTKDGYLFNGWYNDRGQKIESTTLVTNGAPHTLYARWSPIGGGGGGGAVVPQEPETINGYSVSCKDCPRDKTCPAYRFKDLDLKLWYHDGIHFCVENGLMQGIPEGLFAPNGTTTRAQIVTILWRVEGMPFVERASFPDVTDDSWYAGSVNWAAANGIVLGYDDGRFGPDDSITREQFAAILYRYARYKGYDVSVGEDTNILSYEDALKVSDWAVSAVQWACGSGVINGTSESMLSPQDTTTRAQAAAMIMRFVTLA